MSVELYYYQDARGNFGDDLNPWLWSRLLPRSIASCYDPDTMLVGIGTLLNDRIPLVPTRKIVFGSGAGYGPPPMIGPNWQFLCVRGPRTADAMGLPFRTAITDAAVLVREFVRPARKPEYPVAFMPHHRTPGDWAGLCSSRDIHYLNPVAAVDETLKGIRDSSLVITEAMHGAIVADALRIPWISVRTSEQILDFKWHDWSESVGLSHSFEPLSALSDATAVRVSPGSPTLITRQATATQLEALAYHGPKRLSPDQTFWDVYFRLLESLDSLIAGV